MSDEIVKPKKKRIFARIAVIRLLLFFVLLALVYAGGQVLLQQIAQRISPDIALAVSIGGTILVSILAISVYALLVGWLERRDIRELAVLRGFPLLISGGLLAFLMFCGVYAVLWYLHAATWLGIAGYAGVVPFIAMAVLSGVGEELIFRGGVFRILEDMFGTTIALILSGALFGALHLMNPHATWLSSLAIALEAGVLLAAAYAATRNLWFPIGIHIGWNFTEGGVFGAAVSGSGGGHGIVNMPLHGPTLLTGGPFGPEASVVAVAICSVVGLYFVAQTIRRGRWVRASFHMMLD
jgi:membrane protease YdiL (CAAX protease family)